MKNLKFALGVLISLSVAVTLAHAGNGRQVGTPSNPDAASWYGGGCDQAANGNGISGCEVAIDYFGNVVPTVTNAQTLGAASLVWKTIYTVNEVTSGYNELAIQTTTQLAVRADPIGALFLVEESTGGAGAPNYVTNAYNACISTAAQAGSYVYLSVATNTATAVAGAACIK